MKSDFLEIGTIVAAQGLTGEVRVYPSSDFPERFLEPGQRWMLRPGQTAPHPINLVKGRYLEGKGLYVVQLAGISDRTQAEQLKDCKLLIPASDRPKLSPDEFYVADLIGLPVFDQASQVLIGEVIDIITAGNDLLEVKRVGIEPAESKTVLIPFVPAIVPVVDLKQRRIEITPPSGLIE